MIKINLVRNQIDAAGTVKAPLSGAPAGLTAHPEMRENIMKVLVMIVLTIGLVVYESQTVRGLQSDRAALQGQVNELDTTLHAKETELNSVKDVAERAKELEDKLKILRLLSHLRLREVKTLDFVQSSIPEKVWIKTLDYETERDDTTHGHLNFRGNSIITDDLAEFTKRLEESAYLEQVIIVKNQEVPVGTSKTTTMRDFEFTAQTEVKN